MMQTLTSNKVEENDVVSAYTTHGQQYISQWNTCRKPHDYINNAVSLHCSYVTMSCNTFHGI